MGEAGSKMGMPLDDFTKQVMEGLNAGHDQIIIGAVGDAKIFDEIVDKRRTLFENLAKMIRGARA